MDPRMPRLLAGLALVSGLGCGSTSTTAPTAATTVVAATAPTPATTPAGLPTLFYGAQVSTDGSFVVLRATSVPDHPSPYFGQGSAGYEPPQAGMQVNPNRITSQNMVLRVPVTPQVTSASSDTPLGVMRVSINGVALFNQAARNRPAPVAPADRRSPRDQERDQEFLFRR